MVAPWPAMDAIARQFIDAFNRRDADGLVAVTDPAVQWRPSRMVGVARVYVGHDGIRRWVADLGESPIKHQARVLEVRALEPGRFLVLSEVLLDDAPVCPAAMVARLNAVGRIVEANAYLSDEQMLAEAGIVGDRGAADDPALPPRSQAAVPELPRGAARRRSQAA
ncbi:MAG: nuclear transport factor 2 family protein [Solirubrobacteraceae bacterium]|jgi:hypothetical protein